MKEQSACVTDYEFRSYAANTGIGSHLHSQASLTVVLGGSYEEAIAGSSRVEVRGSALICPGGLPHTQQFGQRGARKIIVTLSGDLLDYLTSTTQLSSAPATRSTAMTRLAARIDAERRTSDDYSRYAIHGLIWQASAELGRGLAGASVPASTIVRKARALIEAANGEPLSIAALSRHVECHPATLIRAFRREHGCTPAAFQRDIRVRKAAELLRNSAMSIAAVGASCGYCDQAHLARSFRAVLGCSPSEYRLRA